MHSTFSIKDHFGERTIIIQSLSNFVYCYNFLKHVRCFHTVWSARQSLEAVNTRSCAHTPHLLWVRKSTKNAH